MLPYHTASMGCEGSALGTTVSQLQQPQASCQALQPTVPTPYAAFAKNNGGHWKCLAHQWQTAGPHVV